MFTLRCRLVVLAVAVLLLAGCGQAQTAQVETATVATSPAAPATAVTAAPGEETTGSGTAPVSEPDPAPDAGASVAEDVQAEMPADPNRRVGLLGLLDGLLVEPERSGGYDRELFRHWIDADGDGCDTRREVLITEAVTAPEVGAGCALTDGVWVSRYDAAAGTGNGRGLDIDHLVPLKEAWESGAHAWDPKTREGFANDLGYEHSLVAVSASSNRSKGAQDPTTWLPPEADQRCWYAAAWIHVKARWELSVDPAEADTLRGIVSGCPNNAADAPPQAPVVTTAATSTTASANSTAEEDGCHPDYSPCIPHLEGDALNCGDLTAAQKPVTVRVPGVDPYRLDRDGDGQGCTS